MSVFGFLKLSLIKFQKQSYKIHVQARPQILKNHNFNH